MTEYRIYRPSMWDFTDPPSDGMGGPAVADRLMLYIVDEDEDAVVGKMSLEEIVRDDIDGASNFEGVVADPHDRDLIGLRDGLRRLADEIDAALRKADSADVRANELECPTCGTAFVPLTGTTCPVCDRDAADQPTERVK